MAKGTVTKKRAAPFINDLFRRLTPEQQKLVTGVAASLVVANECTIDNEDRARQVAAATAGAEGGDHVG